MLSFYVANGRFLTPLGICAIKPAANVPISITMSISPLSGNLLQQLATPAIARNSDARQQRKWSRRGQQSTLFAREAVKPPCSSCRKATRRNLNSSRNKLQTNLQTAAQTAKQQGNNPLASQVKSTGHGFHQCRLNPASCPPPPISRRRSAAGIITITTRRP